MRFMLKLKFIFNKTLLFLGVGLFFFFFVSLKAYAFVKYIHYEGEKWTLYINSYHNFFLLGPWGKKAVLIDHPVNQAWGAAGSFGLVLIYRKGIQFRWKLVSGYNGKEIDGGVLLYEGPDTGFVQRIQIYPRLQGALVKVFFNNIKAFSGEKYIVYYLDTHSHKTIMREGYVKNR